jgi:hypothetical protein
MALIALARATELVPNFQSSDNTVMQDCINAASDVIVRYCNRDFVLTTYDELYDGTGARNLLLNQYPLTQVLRVMYNPINVLQLRMTDQTTSEATWRLDGDSSSPPNPNYLYLLSWKTGVQTSVTIGPLTSSTPTVSVNGGTGTNISQLYTYNDLATAINTYAGTYGWSAQALGIYTTWPISQARPPQGGFSARWFGVSYLTLHSWTLPAFEQNPDIGEIVSPIGFEMGYRNFRVIYQAGYSTVPNPVQQACAALAVSVYNSRAVNANLANENLGGYSYGNIAEKNLHSLDIVSRYGLPLFKNHRIAKFKVTV